MIILLDYLPKLSLIKKTIKLIKIHIGHHKRVAEAQLVKGNLLGIKKSKIKV